MRDAFRIKRNLMNAKHELLGIQVRLKFAELLQAVKAGFNEEQPRDANGRWTFADASGNPPSGDAAGGDIFGQIFTAATRLAAGSPSMSQCVDLCLPLLLRPQSPGSNRNEFSFRRCLNACLGRLGQ